ncbi:MAG: HPr family phosphocarrier protein [Deltaproteobacteria bacterium]|nr:MAG: HPr family phosphocarrier protein [Deltaproteobacteria bacterium]
MSDTCEVSFKERVRVLSRDYLKICLYVCELKEDRNYFTRKLYSRFISTSRVLEDFLDFHGAKNNTTWYFYRELASAVRHLNLGGYSQKHISNRLGTYNLPDTGTFARKGLITLDFINGCLARLSPIIIDEARRLKISLPAHRFSASDFPGMATSEMLPYDIDDEAHDEQRRHLVILANDFLKIAEKFDELEFYNPYNPKELREIIPEKINEVEIRQFEMLVHNLQSSFDTYVIYGGLRFADEKLKKLRSFFSVGFHLLQMTGRLLHLYERHLHDAGYKNIYKDVQDRLCAIIGPDDLLDHSINYGLYFICHYMNKGRRLSREILNENMARARVRVGIPVKLGFHSRPSLLVAKIVRHYGGQVELCVGDDRFDAASVLDIQWAGGKISKENITEVVFDGDVRALRDIEILAKVNYGEDTMGKGVSLPKELGYLK